MSFSSTDSSSTAHGSENFTDVDIEDFKTMNIDFRTMAYDQASQDNNLENSTEFRNYVEEMFGGIGSNRTKRQTPRLAEGDRKQTIFVTCHNAGGFKSARQRWWYIVLANCGSTKGMDVRYKFRMTNGALGDFWHEHFSADEMCKFSLFCDSLKDFKQFTFIRYSDCDSDSNRRLHVSPSGDLRLRN